MAHGKRKRFRTGTIIETSIKCRQKSLSDYFVSTSEGEIISTVCDKVNVGLSTPTTTLTCNPPSFFSGDNVKSSKCYDVGTFRNQMFDAKAGKCDIKNGFDVVLGSTSWETKKIILFSPITKNYLMCVELGGLLESRGY